ncbi:hypothetical protein EA462_14655 [Natrarchaeobius halalkaliphilus]|uniref:WD40 repeat domain-containing protein n=1 Tax=Natrarchaeobius halalkaliphilus TaxID=1679091 RepID=A0A3N6LJ45_9EURY|nr:hypothetical protein [Natrarchaeobius halalkaliphilus]RQG88086.1 hypothetical protein EA462_14655 [Natrarchaeobius halalkaliphilus]
MTDWNTNAELAEWCRLPMPFEASSVSPNGRWAAVSMSESCGIIDLRTETGLYEIARLGWEDYDEDDGTTFHALGSAFGANSEFVAFTRENEILVYATPEHTGKPNATGWKRHWTGELEGTVTDVSVGNSGKTLGGVTESGELALYGRFPEFGSIGPAETVSQEPLEFVAINPERKLVLCGGASGTVRLVRPNQKGGSEITAIDSDAEVEDGYWQTNNEFVFCDHSGDVTWCRIGQKSDRIGVTEIISTTIGTPRAVRVTDDGAWLLVGGDNGVEVFDIRDWQGTGQPDTERTIDTGECRTLAVGASVLAGGGNETDSFLKMIETPTV